MEIAVNFKSASVSALSEDSESSIEAQNDGEMVPDFYRQILSGEAVIKAKDQLTMLALACAKGLSTNVVIFSFHSAAFFLKDPPGNHEGT